jgi:pimeloyl-ACP methyl ester carboxylesterase
MTNQISTFERPDLFAQDTWNRQVEDVHCIIDAIHTGAIEGLGVPLFIAGHSRGGATTLLTAGRDPSLHLAGIITINAVDRCNGLSDEQQRELLRNGSMTTPSARTGQDLPINASWLQEQLDDPASHDVLSLCTTIKVPSLVLHGTEDPGVPFTAAERIAISLGIQVSPVQGGDHVLNTANPAPTDGQISPQLGDVIEFIRKFVNTNHIQTPI